MGQHVQHADAFNAATKQLGGKTQNNPDPAFVPGGQQGGRQLERGHRGPGRARCRGPRPRAREHRRRDVRERHDAGEVGNQQGAVRVHHGDRSAARQRAPGRSGPSHGGRTPADLAGAGTAPRFPRRQDPLDSPIRSTRPTWPPRPSKEPSSEQATQGHFRGLGEQARGHDQGARRAPPRRRHAGHERGRLEHDRLPGGRRSFHEPPHLPPWRRRCRRRWSRPTGRGRDTRDGRRGDALAVVGRLHTGSGVPASRPHR